MNAVVMRLRAEMRGRWRALLSLALIAGVAAGASMAAAAGARRTQTAYPRFAASHDAYDAASGGGFGDDWAERFEAIKKLPMVKDWDEAVILGSQLVVPARRGRPERILQLPEVFITGEPTGNAQYKTNRAKVLEGRLPDQTVIDEVAIPWLLAERHDIRVGDTLQAGIGFDDNGVPREHAQVRVVGIEVSPGEFDAVGQLSLLNVYITPAMLNKYRTFIPARDEEIAADAYTLLVHLRRGAKDEAAFRRVVQDTYDIDVPLVASTQVDAIQKTMRLYWAALWLVAALVAIAGLAIVGQTLARQIQIDSADYPSLRAMGMTRPDLFALAFGRATIVAILAAPLAVGIAFLLSPAMPIGAARIAEPHPGFMFDGVVLGIGFAATIMALLAVAVWPAIGNARVAAALGRAAEDEHASRVVGVVARTSSSASASTGLRMALERGRGRTAVPVWSTILAVATGVAAVVATLTVGRSLTNLIDTPDLAGLTYDAIVLNSVEEETEDPEESARLNAESHRAISAFPFVESAGDGTALNVVIKGVDSFLVAFKEGQQVGFAVIEGRAPTSGMVGGVPEIALGPATLRRLKARIGDVVDFNYAPPEESGSDEPLTQKARVVGIAAIPTLPWAAVPPGEGAVMTHEAVRAFGPDDGGCCFVKFKKGTDLTAARTKLNASGFEAFLRIDRADLVTLQRITGLPALLSAVFGLMGIAALAHVLVTGIRRRRRELAVLKTLGFVASQIRGAIAWQSSAIVAICLVVGIPAGVVLGRLAWRAVAVQFGVVPASLVPVASVAIAVPVVLVLANLIALIPGRSAARTQAATVLRTE
jgi:hypothetical protein